MAEDPTRNQEGGFIPIDREDLINKTPKANTTRTTRLPLSFVLDPFGYDADYRNYQQLSTDDKYLLNIVEEKGNVVISTVNNKDKYGPYFFQGNVERTTRKKNPVVTINAAIADDNSHSPFTRADFNIFSEEYLNYVNKGSANRSSPILLMGMRVSTRDNRYYFSAQLDDEDQRKIHFTAEVNDKDLKNPTFNTAAYEDFKARFIKHTTKLLGVPTEELVILDDLNLYEKLEQGHITGINKKRAKALLTLFGSSLNIETALREVQIKSPDIKNTNAYETARERRNTQAKTALTLAGKFLREHPNFLNEPRTKKR